MSGFKDWLAKLFGTNKPIETAISSYGIEVRDSYKLASALPQFPPDLSVWLGKGKDEILAHLNGLQFHEEPDAAFKSTPEWRRFVFMISWINDEGSELNRFACVCFNQNTGRVWRIQLPMKQKSQLPKVGIISSDDTFASCVKKLGKPSGDLQTAPITREAWWNVNGDTFQVAYYSEPYADIDQVFRAGELDLAVVFRPDLTPPGFNHVPREFDVAKGWD